MSQTLPEDAAAERLRWLHPYLSGQRTLKEMSELSPFGYRTLKRWVSAYTQSGEVGLRPRSRRPHSHAKQYNSGVVKAVRALRRKTGLGPDVLVHLLRREGITVSASGLTKLLKREGLSRSRKRLKKKDTWQPTTTSPGEVIEIDVVYARKFKGKWLFQFTAIDCCTRWRHLWVTPEQSNRTAVQFLRQVVEAAPFPVRAIKTDNGSIFTNYYTGYKKSADPSQPRLHIFDRVCAELGLTHYLIAPGKPAQNGKVERSHRNDRERFWNKVQFKTLREVKVKQRAYARWYNEVCPHLGLNGLTPLEKLATVKGPDLCI